MDGCGVNLLTGAIFELVGPSGGFGRTIFSQFAMTAVPSTPIKPMMATITSVLGGFWMPLELLTTEFLTAFLAPL
jgi:hypothetical protein